MTEANSGTEKLALLASNGTGGCAIQKLNPQDSESGRVDDLFNYIRPGKVH